MPSDESRSALSRRDLLVGAATAGAALALPTLGRAEKRAAAVPLVAGGSGESLIIARSSHTLTPLGDGWAVMVGGIVAGRATTSVVLVNTETNEFSAAAPLHMARARHAAVVLSDGRVLVMGGYNQRLLASVESYDPMTNTWTVMPELPSARADFSAVPTRDGVLMLGGLVSGGNASQGRYAIRVFR